MSDIILATSVGMSESVADNGAAFAYLLQQAAAYGKTAVINGKFNIQTPQVFTGLGRFSVKSITPNSIDVGQGPELNYTGSTTAQPLFKFIACQNSSRWGDGEYGVTINLGGNCRYGINTHRSSASGENMYSNASWNYESVFVNWAGDGGAGIRLTGNQVNSEHRFYRCGGYSGWHIKGVKTVTIATTGSGGLPNGTYTDVALNSVNGGGYWARATIVVSSGSVTQITITNNGWNYAVGSTLSINPIQPTSNQALATANEAITYANKAKFTVATIITNQKTIDYPFSGSTNPWNYYDSGDRFSVNDYNNFTTMWIDGPANGITSTPTTGTWHTGQHILNWTAAGGYGTPIGWICTAGGTPGTWIEIPNGADLGYYGLGDPHKGAAWLEVDNANSVDIEVRNCVLALGAQGIRCMRGSIRSYDTNYGPNSDVDIFNGQNVDVYGGWSEQSCRFLYEPYGRNPSLVHIENMTNIASYPYNFALANGYSYDATSPLTFAPIYSAKWHSLYMKNCHLNAVETTMPMKLMALAGTDRPPQWDVTACTSRKAGVWSETYSNIDNYTSDIVFWKYLYDISLYR